MVTVVRARRDLNQRASNEDDRGNGLALEYARRSHSRAAEVITVAELAKTLTMLSQYKNVRLKAWPCDAAMKIEQHNGAEPRRTHAAFFCPSRPA